MKFEDNPLPSCAYFVEFLAFVKLGKIILMFQDISSYLLTIKSVLESNYRVLCVQRSAYCDLKQYLKNHIYCDSVVLVKFRSNV